MTAMAPGLSPAWALATVLLVMPELSSTPVGWSRAVWACGPVDLCLDTI